MQVGLQSKILQSPKRNSFSFNTPFKLQAIYTTVIGIRQNTFVLHIVPHVCIRTCDTEANRPISWASHGHFEMFKVSHL